MRPLQKTISFFLPLSPILFGLSPLLTLWAANLGQIPSFAVFRSFLFAIALLAGTWGLCWIIFRNAGKAAVMTTLALFLFYSFGQVFDLLGGPGAVQYRYLLAVWGLLLAAAFILILLAKRIRLEGQVILTVMGFVLFLYPAAQVLLGLIGTPGPIVPSGRPIAAANARGPDVYYILIDNYSRSDVLKSLGYDNSSFIDSLTGMGFTVDPCAQSNYSYTHTSMVSALNMDYLEPLNIPIYPERADEEIEDFAPLIQHSRVREQFADLGYSFSSFRGVYPWLDIQDSDTYYDPEVSVNLLSRRESVNFQYLFFHTTMLRPVVDWLETAGDRLKTLPGPVLGVLKYINPKAEFFVTRPYLDDLYNQFTFDRLIQIPHQPGSKFVYAHVFSAHVPYIYHADGSLRAGDSEDAESYLQSVQYTEKRLIEVLQVILRDSPQPPVIILQSDHGFPSTPDRVKILSAFYLPGNSAPAHGHTPVNTFRMVFRQYFQLDYPPLPNDTYYTPPGQAYRFDPVEPGCAE